MQPIRMMINVMGKINSCLTYVMMFTVVESTKGYMMSNYGEQKGERKRARALATLHRHNANAQREKQLSQCPSTQAEAAARWDAFYRTKPNLFRDRHLLREIFPQLVGVESAANPKRHVPPLEPEANTSTDSLDSVSAVTQSLAEKLQTAKERGCDQILLEAGCGGGNAVFPVLRANPRLFAFAFDFSKEAVSFVQASPEYRSNRIHAFQADLTKSATFLDTLRLATTQAADFVTVFWTLSALPSSAHQVAVTGLVSALREGGTLFFRDYAIGDMREQKFTNSGRAVTTDKSERLFLRGDGTYAYFFEKKELQSLFEHAGLFCESCTYEERTVKNHKESLVMKRRWLQATFRRTKQSLLQRHSTATW